LDENLLMNSQCFFLWKPKYNKMTEDISWNVLRRKRRERKPRKKKWREMRQKRQRTRTEANNNTHQTKILTNLLFFGITGWPLFFSNSLIAFSSSSLFFCKYSSLSFICLSLSIFFCFSLSIFSKPSLIHAGNCLLFAASGIMTVVFSYPKN